MNGTHPDQIRDHILHRAAEAGHTLDGGQLEVVEQLVEFGGRLRASGTSDAHPSLYLWGNVGRGKTWLADAFLDAIGEEGSRRLHFHSFYRQLQHDLYRDGMVRPGHASAIDEAIDALLSGVELLFFDEFHLHDPGDATLALRVLREAERRGVSMLATSNYPPEGLLPDEMFHHLFAPGVELLRERFTIVTVDGDTDYRRERIVEEHRSGFARGAWQGAGRLERPSADEQRTLRLSGHDFSAARADTEQLWFTFEALCERPSSPADYLAWAEDHPRWVVEGVPVLTECTPQARQRFLNLVDVLNDRGVETVFISDHTPEEVLAKGAVPTARGAAADREELGLGLDGLPIDVARTASRLALLRRP